MILKLFGKDNQAFLKFWGKAVVFIISWLAILVIGVYDKELGGFRTKYIEGQPSDKDIYSPYSFTYVNEEETEIKKKYERDLVNPIYSRDLTNLELSLKEIDSLFESASGFNPEAQTLDIFVGTLGGFGLPEETLKFIVSHEDPQTFILIVKKELQRFFETGILNEVEKTDLKGRGRTFITLIENQEYVDYPFGDFPNLKEAVESLQGRSSDLFQKGKKSRTAFKALIEKYLTNNLAYDSKATEERREMVFEKTQPVFERVLKGEIVLRKGQLITEEDLKRLNEIEKQRGKNQFLMAALGFGSLSFIILIVLFVALSLFEGYVFRSRTNLLAICSVVVFVFLICKVLVSFTDYPGSLLPIALAPVLVSILFRPRTGMIIAVVETLLVAEITGYDPNVIIMGLTGGIVGLYAAKGITKRSEFFRISIYVGAVNFISSFGYHTFIGINLQEALYLSVFGIINGLIILPFLMVIPVFEKLFHLTSDITLLELSDLNHPILRRMVIEAPGSYHHSLVVSNLTENACRSIGANSLLARVGGYFHDIGKLVKPDYFTENQGHEGYNKHEGLSPSMSCLIIVNHVKDGIELAKKNKLPKVVIDFIPQHQGTGLIKFFYKKALDEAKEGEVVNMDDYRYPGPKPQFKETGVIHLADSVEAATRALNDPTPSSIETQVAKIINEKIMDGQLDECDLTFLDINKIKASFVRDLIAIHHSRIKYPEITSAEKKND